MLLHVKAMRPRMHLASTPAWCTWCTCRHGVCACGTASFVHEDAPSVSHIHGKSHCLPVKV